MLFCCFHSLNRLTKGKEGGREGGRERERERQRKGGRNRERQRDTDRQVEWVRHSFMHDMGYFTYKTPLTNTTDSTTDF
jgi:hypothetical protein